MLTATTMAPFVDATAQTRRSAAFTVTTTQCFAARHSGSATLSKLRYDTSHRGTLTEVLLNRSQPSPVAEGAGCVDPNGSWVTATHHWPLVHWPDTMTTLAPDRAVCTVTCVAAVMLMGKL